MTTVKDISKRMKEALPPEMAQYVDAFVEANKDFIEAKSTPASIREAVAKINAHRSAIGGSATLDSWIRTGHTYGAVVRLTGTDEPVKWSTITVDAIGSLGWAVDNTYPSRDAARKRIGIEVPPKKIKARFKLGEAAVLVIDSEYRDLLSDPKGFGLDGDDVARMRMIVRGVDRDDYVKPDADADAFQQAASDASEQAEYEQIATTRRMYRSASKQFQAAADWLRARKS